MTLIPSSIQDESTIALDACGDRLLSLDRIVLLTHLVDQAGSDVLPHLAQRFHILHTVAWKNAENLAVKRGLIKSAMRRHRLKGTLAGFRLAANDAGCSVIKAVTPPAKAFLSPSLTVAERNAFVSKYPQLRIYRYRTAGKQIGLMLGEPLGRRFPVKSEAVLRIAPRAWLVKNGVSTELTMAERTEITGEKLAASTTVTEVAIPGSGSRLSFCCGYPQYLTVTAAAKRFYCMSIGTVYKESAETVRRITVDAGLTPINIQPDNIAETGAAKGIFIDRFVQGQFRASTATDRIYQRFYLFDPEIEVERHKAMQYLNAGRLEMPRHHAELTVSVPGKAAPGTTWRFIKGCLADQPKTRLADMFEAMRDMHRLSDRIAIGFVADRTFTAGETLLAGEGKHLFGDINS